MTFTRRRLLFAAVILLAATGVLMLLAGRPAARAETGDDGVTIIGGEMVNPVVWSHMPVPTTTTTTTTVTTPPVQPRRAPTPHHLTVTPHSSAPADFQACVKWRESGNNYRASSAGAYGILVSTWRGLGRAGTAGTATPAEQDAAFHQLYARDGVRPWRAYDGC